LFGQNQTYIATDRLDTVAYHIVRLRCTADLLLHRSIRSWTWFGAIALHGTQYEPTKPPTNQPTTTMVNLKHCTTCTDRTVPLSNAKERLQQQQQQQQQQQRQRGNNASDEGLKSKKPKKP
jgi:hypothetical protein